MTFKIIDGYHSIIACIKNDLRLNIGQKATYIVYDPAGVQKIRLDSRGSV